ncbi:MauM/NapG family ferredoxin protein [Desulfosalsimonas propionicica]|uniref:MauM/NapG family ferredoxin protein n=1 Tax=Desulfosalsimonas propionicica TaxID=332175 RepID=A0A7W0C734_9BACT|nr:4Fe-4S binding protein [Desulfosalsimonas propionicica]MBA2880343.1 MauM/NapG family ferredoxin protein [Desulfosalsimonas propionicica]
MMFRRMTRAMCLAIFLVLLAGAGKIAASDLFLRMDPALTGLAGLAMRSLTWIWLPAVIVMASALLAGRIFCGYICPMGTTIDVADKCLAPAPKKQKASYAPSARLKYYILTFAAGAALCGVTFVYWAAPLSLITRFYGLVVYPVVLMIGDQAVTAFYPIASRMDLRTLMFLEIDPPRFATGFFVLLFFAAVFAAARISPRFWCRYLCPSGALLAILSRKPLIRRRVSPDCNQCGICVRNCPMAAIDPDAPEQARHEECIVCRQCESICPKNAVAFSADAATARRLHPSVSPARRQVIFSGIAGAATASVALTGLNVVARDLSEKGTVREARIIRPPGALPEPDFLEACVRCGQCMAACPTNTLQPVWFEAGLLGLFSPAVTPRRKYCDPECTACGNTCPTGAIQKIASAERTWAKIGTAVIYRQQCLAWEYKKSCMVCDEVCPYDALEFEKRPDLPYPVPHVKEDRCAGCGHCEHACPVYNQAAIVVTPMDAIRLRPGQSFEYAAKSRGFKLKKEPQDQKPASAAPAYPGADIPDGRAPQPPGMAPGFDEGG